MKFQAEKLSSVLRENSDLERKCRIQSSNFKETLNNSDEQTKVPIYSVIPIHTESNSPSYENIKRKELISSIHAVKPLDNISINDQKSSGFTRSPLMTEERNVQLSEESENPVRLGESRRRSLSRSPETPRKKHNIKHFVLNSQLSTPVNQNLLSAFLTPPVTPENSTNSSLEAMKIENDEVFSPPPPPPPPLQFFNSSVPPSAPPLFKFFNPPASPTRFKKSIPKCNVPMKCFNLKKISSFEDTIWKEVNEEKYEEECYKQLNLELFEKTFSVYHSTTPSESDTNLFMNSGTNSLMNLNSHGDFMCGGETNSLFSSKSSMIKSKKEFSVIEQRRATNLQIFLANFKKNKRTINEELTNLILKMDPGDELGKDTIEQMLKYVPTLEEKALLEENSSELANMAEPDRFLYDMGKIFHYKQKLESLYFIKRYIERSKEISANIELINGFSHYLLNNKNVTKMLRIVLCLVNYTNQDHKIGFSFGFNISSLNKLIDQKGSNDKTYSFLHYLVNSLDSNVS